MIIGLLRHAIAEDALASTGFDDSVRALTPDGIARMTRAARGIRRLDLGFDVILTSPLTRCVQTAGIVADALGIPVVQEPRLRPGMDAARMLEAVMAHPQAEAVLVCGHQPDLSEVAFDLLRGGVLEFKKGALAVIETGWPPMLGMGLLTGHYPPATLRALGGAE